MKNLLVFLILVNFFTGADAAIRLPKLIGNGMVLQRQTPLKIWGWADAGEKVRLSFRGKNYYATTNNKGEWLIKLPAQQAGGPFTMKISGQNELQIQNVLVGDVWLCSGQSNMELWMGRLKYRYAADIANSTNTNIRQFLVPDQYDLQNARKELGGGEWLEANPGNLMEFSGLAYFFARELYNKYKIPIGIINAALGGSPIQAWISEEALKNSLLTTMKCSKIKTRSCLKKSKPAKTKPLQPGTKCSMKTIRVIHKTGCRQNRILPGNN